MPMISGTIGMPSAPGYGQPSSYPRGECDVEHDTRQAAEVHGCRLSHVEPGDGRVPGNHRLGRLSRCPARL